MDLTNSCKKKNKCQLKKNSISKRKNYEDSQMLAALNAVQNGVAVATAARNYRVPRVTLMSKASGKSPVSSKPGPASVLTKDEEQVLVHWIKRMFKAGCPVTSDQLRNSVQLLFKKELKRKSPFIDDRPGKKWLASFKKRHPSISKRIAENSTVSRVALTREDIRAWFTRTEDYLREHSLFEILEDRRRIFNGGETSFFLNPKGKKVLAPKDEKMAYFAENNDEKECLTVLITANACGELAPPTVVFKYERVPDAISESIPDCCGMGKSENGWMNVTNFYEYFTKILDPWLDTIKIARPIIFFVDGHVSQLTYHLIEFCQNKDIILINLPPNSSHFMQPIDVSVFRSLKENWKTKVHDLKHVNKLGVTLKKKKFFSIMDELLSEKTTASMVANGFRECGLVPWDISALNLVSDNTTHPISSDSCTSTLDSKRVLEGLSVLERFIGEETLKLFRESSEKRGTGNIEDVSLFEIWKRMRSCCFRESMDIERPNPSQEEVENDYDNPAIIPSTSCSEEHQLIDIEGMVQVQLESAEEANTFGLPRPSK